MQFTLTVPAYWNFTPTALMLQYVANNRAASFNRDEYFNCFIYTNGKRYYYDHWNIEDDGSDPDTIKVTVFLKEKKQ